MGATDWSTGLPPAARADTDFPYSGDDAVAIETREIYRKLGAALDAGGSSYEGAVQINQWVNTYSGFDGRAASGRPPRGRALLRAVAPGRHAPPRDPRRVPPLRQAGKRVHAGRPLPLLGRASQRRTRRPERELGDREEGLRARRPHAARRLLDRDRGRPMAIHRRVHRRRLRPRHPAESKVPDFIWYGNQIYNETVETLRQLKITVEAGGGKLDDTVKALVYLTPFGMRNLPALNKAWADCWPESPPSRAIIPCTGVGLRGTNVEIMLTVARPDQGRDRARADRDGQRPGGTRPGPPGGQGRWPPIHVDAGRRFEGRCYPEQSRQRSCRSPSCAARSRTSCDRSRRTPTRSARPRELRLTKP